MKMKEFVYSFCFSLLLFSCAQIVPLTGGEKDISPPKEIESTPPNGALFFNEETIEIEFDEFIKLNNLPSQLLISPIIEPEPEITVKGKKLVINLPSDLLAKTTYSFNFGNAIADITESNGIENFKYVFSTGDFLDSLGYTGKVLNAMDLMGREEVYVMLYDNLADSIPIKELPRYVSMTDEQGNFSITNIAQGEYKLFAIKDINSNYLFDLPNEEIAFLDHPIQIDSSTENNTLYLFAEKNEKQYIKESSYDKYGKIDIVLNQPMSKPNINILTPSINEGDFIVEKNKSNDSLTVWLKFPSEHEVVDLLVEDLHELLDTVSVRAKKKDLKGDSVLHINTNLKSPFDLNKDIILTTERPISEKSLSSIELFEDSSEVDFAITPDSMLARRFIIKYPFKEKKKYILYIPPNTFTDMYNQKNDTCKIEFNTLELADYGTILLKVSPNFSENYILQLNKGNKTLTEEYGSEESSFTFDYLSPGTYQLKLIVDKNKDKKWTSGNYLKGIQPERVILYEKDISIRPNWDNEITWIIKN